MTRSRRGKKEDVTVNGTLLAFFETGTEGVLWSFMETGKLGYDALHVLEKGDRIKVFNDAARKDVVFDGAVDLEYRRRYHPYPGNPKHGQQVVDGMWVHGLQRGETPERWAAMFFDEKPAELTRHVRVKKPRA